MIKNANVKVIERKAEIYQRKYAFMMRNEKPIIFVAYPLIFPRGKHPLNLKKIPPQQGMVQAALTHQGKSDIQSLLIQPHR